MELTEKQRQTVLISRNFKMTAISVTVVNGEVIGAFTDTVIQDYNTSDTVAVKVFSNASTDGDKIHPNPYKYEKVNNGVLKYTEDFIYKYENSWYHRVDSGYSTVHADTTHFIGNSEFKALKKLYKKIQDSDFNLAQAILVEGRDNVRLLRDSVKGLETLTRSTKKLLSQNPTKLLSDAWLEYSLGWRPLANDIFNLLKQLEKCPLVKGQKFQLQAVSKDTETLISVIDDLETKIVREGLYKVGVSYEIKNVDVFRQRQSGILNPINLAWQYAHLSFVADWFYDVSGLLQSLEGAIGAGLTFKAGYSSVLFRNRTQVSRDKTYPLMWAQWSGYSSAMWPYKRTAFGIAEYAYHERVILTGFPIPPLPRLNLSGVDSMEKAATAASLLIQRALAHGKKAEHQSEPPRIPDIPRTRNLPPIPGPYTFPYGHFGT